MKRITQWVVVCLLAIAFAWDIIAQTFGGLETTMSALAWQVSEDYPIVAPITGVIMGHLFSGPGKNKGFEQRYKPWLIGITAGMVVALLILEGFGLFGSPQATIDRLRSPELAFVRLIMGAFAGRWLWGDPRRNLKDV